MATSFGVNRGSEFRWKLYLCLCVIYLPVTLTTHIEIDSDGGYKKIVLAVSKRTLETYADLNELQSKFKDFFSKVSDELFVATRNRSFLSEIQILLPHLENSMIDVSKIDTKDSTFESFQQADIRFDTYNPVPERGDVYTHQPRGCGKRGDFIYLNPNSIDDKNYTHVKKFVQEWAKFRYGVFDESGDGSVVFPTSYTNENGKSEITGCADVNTSFSSIMDTIHSQSNTFCDDTDIDHQHNKFAPNRQNAFCQTSSTWNVTLKKEDFRNFTIVKKPNSAPKINFVKLLANVVIVIDPMMCKMDENGKTIHDSNSHTLNLALRKFIQDSPSYVHIGFVVALTKPEIIPIRPKNISLLKEVQVVADNHKDLLSTIGLEAGILAANKMLSAVTEYGNLILITSTAQLKGSLDHVTLLPFQKPKSASFFLLTWTKNQTSSWSNKNIEQLKNFVNYPTQYLWMDIVVKNNFSICDVNSRLQIEDAFHQFFTKFLQDDFYSSKIKIKQCVMGKGIASSFRLPFTKASVIFNIYGCKYLHDERTVSLTVNKNPVHYNGNDDDLEKDISFSYKWENSMPDNSEISFETVLSNSTLLGSSVWIEVPIAASFKASDVKVEREKGDNSPVVLYSFTPSNINVYVEITCETNFNVTVELRDNGNGDPDVMVNDKIFSRYFVNSHSNKVFALKVIANDSRGNIIDQRNLGSIAIKVQNLTDLPPNRIVDFYSKSVEFTSPSTTFSWTSPGEHYDNGTANAYYLKCVTNFNDLNLHIRPVMDEKEKIGLIPKNSGSKEEYTWAVKQRGTVYFCSIASTNQNQSSEWSNIVSVYVEKLPTTTTKSPPTTSSTISSPIPSVINSSIISAISSTDQTTPTNNYTTESITTQVSPANGTIAGTGKSTLATGEIVALAIGIFIFVSLLVALAIFLLCVKKRKLAKKSSSHQTHIAPSAPNNRVSIADSNSSGETPHKPQVANQRNILHSKSSTKNADFEKRASHLQDDDDSVSPYATSQFVQQPDYNQNMQDNDHCAYAVSSYVPPTQNVKFPVTATINVNPEDIPEEAVAYATSPFVSQPPIISTNKNNIPTDSSAVYSTVDKSKKNPKDLPTNVNRQKQPNDVNSNAVYSTVDKSKKNPKPLPPNINSQDQAVDGNMPELYSTVDKSKKTPKDLQSEANSQEGAEGVNLEALYSSVEKPKKKKLPVPAQRGPKPKIVTSV